MTFEKIGIATARINGLTKSPDYRTSFFAWKIMFSERSLNFDGIYDLDESFYNLAMNVGDIKAVAESRCNTIKKQFEKVHISDGDRVAIIFKEDRHIRAIGTIGRDCWIDVDDSFSIKTFEELNIVITSLKVH